MRTQNSIRNLISAFIGQMLAIFITFIARLVFLKTLGTEYLGINGLFMNILSVLSLAEMGFGTAIIYFLYKPLANRDLKNITAIINFYKKAYRYIGCLVFIIGLSIVPYLGYFIKEDISIPHLKLIYFLYLINSVITYFFAYNRSLIIADQKSFITTLYRYTFFIITNIIQMIILLKLQNFILYLCTQIIFSFLENYMVHLKARKMFPFLKDYKDAKIESSAMKKIIKNVRAMVYHRIGDVVVNGTDNLLISVYLGLKWVGLYSNYYLIITALNTILSQFFSSITASIGNLNALESKERSRSLYNSIIFANSWIVGFSAISLWVLLNPFITIWLGEDYLIDKNIIILIVINFYIKSMRKTTLVFRDSFGLYWNDRYKPVFESIINFVVSIILVQKMGISGVFLGTLVSSLLTCFWIEPFILYKYGFEFSVIDYYKRYFKYSFVIFVAGYITTVSSELIIYTHYLGLIIKIFLCILIINIAFIICFYRTTEFKYFKNIILNIILKKTRGQKMNF